MHTESEALITRAVQAWTEAARVFGIELTAPYTLRVGDRSVECLACLPHFGGPRGMVATLLLPPEFECDPQLVNCAEKAELFYSFLNPESYAAFDAELFRETLIDWGWFGPAERRPGWLAVK